MDLETWVGRMAIVIAGIGAIFGAILGVVRTGKRLAHFLDDWFGEEARPGVAARPGVMERLERLEELANKAAEGPDGP